MAGFPSMSNEDIQRLLRKLTNPDDQSASQYQLPPDILEALAATVNRPGGRKVMNSPDGEEKKVIKDFSHFAMNPNESSDHSGTSKRKRFALLKEKARALAARSKYYEATSILEDIDSEEEITGLGMKLLMAECYLQLGRENKANRSIRALRFELLKNPALKAEDALGLVENLVDNKSFTSALILVPVASELFQRLDSPDNQLDGIFRCIKKASDCTGPMISSGGRARILAIDFGVDYMVDALKDFENLKADPQKKAFKQCLATMLVAYDFWSLKENLKGVRIREVAVAAMDRAFGPQAAKQRRIYGSTLYNIGVGYAILNKHTEAKSAYERAIDAIEAATDYDDESSRQRDVKMYKQKLKELKSS